MDQNKAFSEFNIALKQIIEKLDPASRAAKMKDTVNFANNNGMTVKEVSFYRKLGNYHNVDQQHADENEQKLKKLFDLRGNPDAFKKDPMMASLMNFDTKLADKLANAKDLTEFIPMLIQAMAEANKHKDTNKKAANAVKAGKEFLGNNDALWALWTDKKIKYLSPDEIKTLRSSKDQASKRHQNKSYEAITQADRDENNSASLGNISVAEKGAQNAADTSLNTGMVSLGQLILEAIYKKTNEINDDPTFKGKDAAEDMGLKKGLEQWEKMAPYFAALENILDVAVSFSKGGGALGLDGSVSVVKAFTEGIKAVTLEVYKFKAGLESQKYFDNQPLNKAMTMSTVEVNKRLDEISAQVNNPQNQKAKDYYGQKGIYFQQNSETLQIEAHNKDGKVIEPAVKSLDEITRSLQWIQDPKHKQLMTDMNNKYPDLNVDINLKTGEMVMVDKKGNIAANLGNTHSGYGGVQSYMAGENSYGLDKQVMDYRYKMQEEIDKKKKEVWLKKQEQRNAQLRADQARQNQLERSKVAPVAVPDAPVPLPEPQNAALPDVKLAEPLLPVNIGKFSKNNQHSDVQKNRQLPNKRPTAHDVQMAKECSHIENSNNSYKYDVKITVNPSSGDPIKIAQQVCEQLKRHTCGSGGMGNKNSEQRRKSLDGF